MLADILRLLLEKKKNDIRSGATGVQGGEATKGSLLLVLIKVLESTK